MKRCLKLIVLLVMILMLSATTVNALSFTATMSTSQSSVAEASEVVVTIKVSNLDVGANGINSLSGYLKYDTEVFEEITDTNIEGLEGWVAAFNPENGKIGLLKNTFVKEEQNVVQITFKTKAGTANKSGTISFETIEASNSEEEIKASDISASITVTAGNPLQNTTIDIPYEPENIVEENEVENEVVQPQNTYVNTYKPVNTNPANDTIPHTGVEDNIMFAIIIFAIIAIISFIKYKNIKEY